MPTTGQFFFGTQGGGADGRVVSVNSDGTAQVTVVDNTPTVDLITSNVSDLGLDTAAGFYFAIANGGADGSGGYLIRGSITGGGPATIVADYRGNVADAFDDIIVNSLVVDSVNNRIYVGYQEPTGSVPGNSGIRQYSYNPITGAVTDLGFLTTATSSGKPLESGFNIFDPRDFDFNPATGRLFFTELLTGGVSANGLWRVDVASPNVVTQVVSQAQFPDSGSAGYIIDVEVDTSTGLLYFSTESQTPSPGAGYNAAQNAIWFVSQNGAGATAVKLTITGLPGGNVFYPGDMVFDQSTRQLYVESEESDAGGAPNDVIYVLQLDAAGTTASLVKTIVPSPAFTTDSVNIQGMAFNTVPVLAALLANATAAVEQGTNISLLTGAPTIADDGNRLSSATVQITGGTFSSNENSTADDHLAVGAGLQVSGLVAGTNITVGYNAASETLTLTGYDTVANYQNVLNSVRYFATGDNPTNYGANTTRTLTWTVSDGAIGLSAGSPNTRTSTLNIQGVNDAPVNTVGGALVVNEDAAATALTGISVTDPDNNGLLTYTLAVTNGTITLNTAVGGGITAGQITGGANGSSTITVQATQTAINATLANATGLTYTPTANVNGTDTLTVTSSDGSLSDIDPKTITINAVNDAPVATGSTAAAQILEDSTPAGQTVSALFSGNFSDATDQVSGGSSANAFAGIVVTDNVATPASGVWQFSTNGGTSWTNVATGVTASTGFALAATALVRFLPALNFNGIAPTMSAILVDASGGAVTSGATVNVTTRGGTTAFSSASVLLGQGVTSVNDAPTSTGLQGDSVTTTEPAGAGSVMPGVKIDLGGNVTISDVDNANFSGGSLTFAITSGKDATQDQLFLDTAGVVTVTSGTVSVSGTAIGTVSGGGAGGSDLVIALNANATAALVQQVIRAATFGSTGGDNPTAGARGIMTTLVDGSGTANGGNDNISITSTVNVVATNDVSVAVADPGNAVFDNSTVTIAVLANDTDPDTTLSVSDIGPINGSLRTIGVPFTLPSGAQATLNANGTITYNPNGAFNYLVDPATAASTGAVNGTANDSFTYTLLNGSSTALVSVVVTGTTGPGDELRGDGTNNTISGTPGVDVFNLSQGGNDTVSGGASDDSFYFGSTFTALDSVDGGLGTNDQVGLQGSYPGLTLGAASLVNVEVLAVLPGFSYNITSTDANIAPGQTLSVFGGNLAAGQNFTFNGAAETDGYFRMFGGLGNDTFTGGSLDDGFYFGPGKWGAGDTVVGGGGTNDQLALDGSYTVSIGPNADVEALILLPGPTGTPNTFNITLTDAWAVGAAVKTVWGLNVVTAMTINGSAETTGSFRIFGGNAGDILTGGTGNDFIFGGGSGDVLRGNAGIDTFYYDNATQSTSTGYDTLIDFNYSADLIQIAGQVHDTYSLVGTGTLSTVTFDANLATALNAQLTNGNAVFFTPDAGTLAGSTFLVVDANGVAGYQAGQDYVFLMPSPPPPLPPADFIIA